MEISRSDGTTKQQLLISDHNLRMMKIEGNRQLDHIADIVQSDKVKATDKFYLFDNHKNSQVNFGFHENNSEDGPNSSFVSVANNHPQKDDQAGSLRVNRKLSTIEEHTYESKKSGPIAYGKGKKSSEMPKKAFDTDRSSNEDSEDRAVPAEEDNKIITSKDGSQQRA